MLDCFAKKLKKRLAFHSLFFISSPSPHPPLLLLSLFAFFIPLFLRSFGPLCLFLAFRLMIFYVSRSKKSLLFSLSFSPLLSMRCHPSRICCRTKWPRGTMYRPWRFIHLNSGGRVGRQSEFLKLRFVAEKLWYTFFFLLKNLTGRQHYAWPSRKMESSIRKKLFAFGSDFKTSSPLDVHNVEFLMSISNFYFSAWSLYDVKEEEKKCHDPLSSRPMKCCTSFDTSSGGLIVNPLPVIYAGVKCFELNLPNP